MEATGEVDRMQRALDMALWVWGLPAWTIYAFSGLVIGYFTYSRRAKFLPSTPILHGFSDKKWSKPIAASLTMSASLGLGVFQVKNAFNSVFGIDLSSTTHSLIILFLFFIVFTAAAILPVKKGMARLGDFNVYIALALLLYVFVMGPTSYYMSNIVSTIGGLFTKIIPISTNTLPIADKTWLNDWPLTTIIWWISWTPFLSVFIDRISKGRTIKEFLLASIIVPTLFLVVWFSVFGGWGMLDTLVGSGEVAKYYLEHPDDVYLTFIMVLQSLPFFKFTGVVFVILIIVFLATSATSSAISLSMITSDGSENAPIFKTLIWSVIMVTIASANVITGTLNGVKAVAVFLGVPYFFFFILKITGFLRRFINDYRKGKL